MAATDHHDPLLSLFQSATQGNSDPDRTCHVMSLVKRDVTLQAAVFYPTTLGYFHQRNGTPLLIFIGDYLSRKREHRNVIKVMCDGVLPVIRSQCECNRRFQLLRLRVYYYA